MECVIFVLIFYKDDIVGEVEKEKKKKKKKRKKERKKVKGTKESFSLYRFVTTETSPNVRVVVVRRGCI